MSACVPVPDGQEFRVSVVGSSEYLTGADGGNSPVSADGSTLVTTTDFSQAIPFRTAPGRNGQITLINAGGTTLYSDQDITGSGDEPIYFDTLQTSEDSGMYPVQFCLQPDDTFVVQNLGTQDPADDANIVQICPGDGAVYLHTADIAAIRRCTTIRLQIAEDPSPTIPSTTTSATPTPTPTIPSPVPSACIPVADGQEFRISLVGSSTEYLTGGDGGLAPAGNEAQTLVTTTDYSQAIPFTAEAGRDGQITLVNSAGAKLYSDQDITGQDGPVYFDDQVSYDNFDYLPVQFCLQPDNTFVVQNLGQNKQDPADDANVVQICPAEDSAPANALWLYTANGALASGCRTGRLQIAAAPPPARCPANSAQIPENQRFRIRSTLYPDRWVFSQASGTIKGTTTNIADAVIFRVSSGRTDQISTISNGVTDDSQFIPNFTPNSGYASFYRNADITTQPWGPLLFCLQPDNTFAVQSVGGDGPGPNDANTAVTCSTPSEQNYIDNGDYIGYFSNFQCFPDTFVYEPVVYVPPIGCPATTVPIPDNARFRLKSSVYANRWLSAVDGDSAPQSGNIITTEDINDAIPFTATPGNTGQVSLISTSGGGDPAGRLDSIFFPFSNANSGILYFDESPSALGPPAQLCLQPDNTFVMHSGGSDGPGAYDPYMVLVCPQTNRLVFLDNGSDGGAASGCVADTLLFDPL